MQTDEKIVLPDNHKRSLSVTAHHLENSINDVEDLLTNKRQNTLTEKIIKNLNNIERQEILKLTKLVREKNERMFKELELNKNDLFEDRIVRSRIGHIWTLLCDSTPESLKGYGNLSEAQSKLISTYIDDLLQTVNEIQSVISRNT